MKKLNMFFIIAMSSGIVMIAVGMNFEMSTNLTIIGYLIGMLSILGYALNGGK